MQIGKVAKVVGLSVDTIRFYERRALLRRPPRTQGGFRLYGEKDLAIGCPLLRIRNSPKAQGVA